MAAVVRRGERVLLGFRVGSHGAGSWQFPGGHLEHGEAPEDCAARELLEETGMSARVRGRGPYTNDVFEEKGRHYVTLFVLLDWVEGEPRVTEPDKCREWRWFAWDRLPAPLFLPIRNLVADGLLSALRAP